MEPTAAQIAAFIAFIRDIMGVPDTTLPDSSPYIIYSLTGAVNTVLLNIQCASPFLYQDALNNLAADNLINWTQDSPTADPKDYWAKLRASFGCNNFAAGVVQSANDNSTGMSALVPDFFKGLTMSNLQNLKTPYGRRYLAIVQDWGSIWGLTQ